MNREAIKFYFLVFVVLTCCACSPVIDLAVGHKVGSSTFADYGGDNPTLTLRVRQDMKWNTFVEYEHISHLKNGEPFNDDPELYVDQVNFGIRFKTWDITE